MFEKLCRKNGLLLIPTGEYEEVPVFLFRDHLLDVFAAGRG